VADPAAAGMQHIDYGLSIIDRDAMLADIPAGAGVDLASVYTLLPAERRLAGRQVFERFYEMGSSVGLAELEDHLSASVAEGRR